MSEPSGLRPQSPTSVESSYYMEWEMRKQRTPDEEMVNIGILQMTDTEVLGTTEIAMVFSDFPSIFHDGGAIPLITSYSPSICLLLSFSLQKRIMGSHSSFDDGIPDLLPSSFSSPTV